MAMTAWSANVSSSAICPSREWACAISANGDNADSVAITEQRHMERMPGCRARQLSPETRLPHLVGVGILDVNDARSEHRSERSSGQ